MIEFLLWLVVVEILGLVALPLAMATLPNLSDRGYGLAKILGILLVTFINYLLGSTLGLGNNVPLLMLGLIVALAVGLYALGPERRDVATWVRANRRALMVEEAIFVILFVIWTLVRAAHPGILSTEKPMDLAMMTASHKATSFPPYDPWLAGTTINYYYGGYLAVGTLVTLTGVAPAVGFNLALALLFALVGTAAFSIIYNLTRDLRWSAVGPLFVLLVGNLDGLIQFFDPAHGTSHFDFFRSSRVVEGNACGGGYCTINEFPAFSFLLGDLHPHVEALPFTLLAIGLALNLALAPAAGWAGLGGNNLRRALLLVVLGIAVGALYFMNSWDWPTYLLLCGAALLVPALPSLDWRAIGEAVGLAVGVLVLNYLFFFEFRRDFKPQYSSFGIIAHNSPTGEVLVMFGLFLLPLVAFLVAGLAVGERVPVPEPAPAPRSAATAEAGAVTATRKQKGGVERRAATAVMERGPEIADPPDPDDLDLPKLPGFRRQKSRTERRAETAVIERESEQTDPPDPDDDLDLPRLPTFSLSYLNSPLGSGLSLVVAAVVLWWLLSLAHGMSTAGLLLPFGLAALYLAWREGRAGRSRQAFALLLCAGGIGLVVLCDLFYLKDNFCGPLDASGNCTGDLYRMNSVFKFYYQAWTVLALGAAYGLYYLSTRFPLSWRYAAPAATGVLAAAGGIYMGLGLFTQTTNVYTIPVAQAALTLDGSAYLDTYSGQPITITNALPADAKAIRWLNANVSGHPTILEADQIGGPASPGPQDYWYFPGDANQELSMSRISTFTGLPAVLGMGYSHEGLWHGNDVVATRFKDVQTMYTSTDPGVVGALLRQYKVRYIYFGQIEAYTYYNSDPVRVSAALARFKSFGRVVYDADGVTIIRTNFG